MLREREKERREKTILRWGKERGRNVTPQREGNCLSLNGGEIKKCGFDIAGKDEMDEKVKRVE